MRVSIILLPILTGLGLANVIRERAAQGGIAAAVSDAITTVDSEIKVIGGDVEANCCAKTLCFVGCATNAGVFLVSCFLIWCLIATTSMLT